MAEIEGDAQDYLAARQMGPIPEAVDMPPSGGNVGQVKQPQKPQLSPQSTEKLDFSPTPSLKQYDAPVPGNYGLDPSQKEQSPFEVFKDPMVVLAGLSSLFTRRPLTSAMNYAAGAMEGFHKGKQDIFEENKKKFDEAIKATIEQNKTELNRYNEAWDRKKEFDWQKIAPKLLGEAAASNDQLLSTAIQAGKWDLVEKIISGRETAQNRIQTAVDMEKAKEATKIEEVETLKKDPNVIARAKAIRNYEQAPLSTTGFAGNNPYNQAVMSLVTQMAESEGEPYETPNYAAKNRFISGLGSTAPSAPGGRVNAINTSIRHFETLDKIIDDLGKSDQRSFRRAAQAMQVEFGLSEAPTNFDVAKGIVASEMVKAVVASGGGVTDRVAAQAEFDRANSPKLLHGAVNTAKQLIAGQMQSIVDQAHALRADKQLDRMLPQTTRDVLAGSGQKKPTPTEDDRKWVRKHPEDRQKFINHFGIEP